MKNLQTKTVRELVELARQWGLTGYSKLKKAELVRKLSKKFGKKPIPKKPGKTATAKKKTKARTKKKPEPKARQPAANKPVRAPAPALAPTPAPAPQVERRTLPASYGGGRMMLVARDPYWLYAYWDLTSQQEEKLWTGAGATLRVLEVGDSGAREISRIPVTRDARSWYLQVDTSNRTYQAELGVTNQQGEFVAVIASNLSFTPSDSVSDSQEHRFGVFSPGAPPAPAAAPDGLADREGLSRRMYDLSTGSGMDSAQAQAAWRQQSSFDIQKGGGGSEKGE